MRLRVQPLRIASILGLCAAVTASTAKAEIRYSLTFNDPDSLLTSHHDAIESNVLAAASIWAEHLRGDADLEIVVTATTTRPRGWGRSLTAPSIGTGQGIVIREQGAAYEIRTGTDPNGSTPDIEIGLNPDYVEDELWFDPSPLERAADVPSTRTDAVTVMLHELGHAFAFNGWLNGTDLSPPTTSRSTWDILVTTDGTDFFFTGQRSMQVYGGPVPVTYGNPSHVGNSSPRPGSDLVPQLMNGVVFFRGRRYEIGALELAVLHDCGMQLRSDCPADADADGKVDVLDLLAYLDLWFAGSWEAELTGDGPASIDVFDMLVYLDRWFAGCP